MNKELMCVHKGVSNFKNQKKLKIFLIWLQSFNVQILNKCLPVILSII